MQVSIIIVNYNTCNLLRECLSSILQHTHGLDFEIIVIDNASNDGSREMLEKEFPQVVRIYNPRNIGFAAANNQGIKRATGNYILLLNSDTRIIGDAIRATYDFMEKHPRVGIAGCKLLHADGSLQPSCRSFPSVWNIFVESFFLYLLFRNTKLFGRYYMSYFDHQSVCEVEVVMGAFMFIRRTTFDTVGLFDEDYFLYSEETDFCYRAHRAGIKTFFYPHAAIIHLEGGSASDSQLRFRRLHQGVLLFLRKHFTGASLIAAISLKQLGVILRIFIYFAGGQLTRNPLLVKKAKQFWGILFSPAECTKSEDSSNLPSHSLSPS